MSHFTHIQTRFQNFSYLEKALNNLKISYVRQENNTNNFEPEINKKNLVISQKNGYNIEFSWTGKEYELITDMSFWEQQYPIESFIDKISQQYANAVIVGESKKTGFQLIKSGSNLDGSNTLVLERWNKI